MNCRHLHYLLHPVFLLGLIILLLNDHYLKAEFGNWWTGKLSDFAGVLLLPLFWKAVFGGSNRTAILVTVGFFTWWKLPVSQPALDGLNALTGLAFSRVVDVTDLLALSILPLSGWALRSPVSINMAPAHRRPLIAQLLVLPLTLAALIATSDPDDDIFFTDGEVTSCCEQLPASLEVDGGTVYLPTAFTPDFDGLNDRFQIIPGDTGIVVDTFRVLTLPDRQVVYEATNITNFEPVSGFDGEVNDTIRPRTFTYSVHGRLNGTPVSIFSFVCSLPCATPSGLPTPMNLDNCVFSTQFVDGGGFDREIDSLEDQENCYD